MRMNNVLKMVAFAGLLGVATSTLAAGAGTTAQQQNCRVDPDSQPQTPQADDASPSKKLDDCNSVLHPPGVGDHEMVKPAPKVGTMPVIPPKAVPNIKNNGNDAETH